MSINTIPEGAFYDFAAWIDLAPDFDWDKLAPSLIEVTATAPTFDYATRTYTIPATEGVRYLVDGRVAPTGPDFADPGATITVTAEALPGYVLVGTAQWVGGYTTGE